MKRMLRWGIPLIAAGLLFCGTGADAQEIMMQKAVVAPGGGTATDGTVTMQYTVAQPIAGTASNGQTTAAFGFWSQAPSISSIDGTTGAGSITALSVTPSPLSGPGQVSITTTAQGVVDVRLYNASGEMAELLFRGEREAGSFALPISVDRLASGTYFVVVRMPGALLQVPVTVTK